ncbi:MAG: 30S ribosomal protein S20 [Candidatus Promineifilaceae bacterium]
MANTASAKKRIRISARRHARNRIFRSAARTYVRRARELLRAGDLEAAQEAGRQAISTLDKAARKGVIHKRNAARRKSRLLKRLAAAQQTTK